MKYNIGDTVFINNNNMKKYVVVKSKFEDLTEDNLRVITAKTNILGLKEKISNIDLRDFDYLLVQSIPTPYPKEIEIIDYEFI